MDDCCAPKTKRAAPGTRRDSHTPCPQCGALGRPVPDETLRAMLPESTALGLLVIERRFCKTKACDVLYYGADGRTVSKSEARVRVGAKETEDPVAICYCFDVARADLRKDVAEHGDSLLLLRIKAEVREGNCACETKNPSGACCLGEVSAEVKEVKKLLLVASADASGELVVASSCRKACCGD